MGKLPAQIAPPPTTTAPWRGIARSCAAILGGYIALTVLVSVAWYGLAALWPESFGAVQAEPKPTAYLIDSLIAAGAGLAAGFLTAWLAGRAELRHALILAGLMAALSVISTLSPQQPYTLPGWHTALLVTIMVITIYLGARTCQARRLASRRTTD